MTTDISDATYEKNLRELEALYGIANVLSASRQQQQMLEEALDVLSTQLDMHRGTVMLLSADGEELIAEIGTDFVANKGRQIRYRRGEGVTGQVVATGKSAIVPKISQEPHFLDRIHQRRANLTQELSFICVPIKIDNETVGTLSVDKLYNPSENLEMDERVLSIVASMIAEDVKSRRESQALRQSLEEENLRLRSELADKWRPEKIVGNSGLMREVYQQIHQVAQADTTVVIRGESGTGKELVAHAIHYSSLRAEGSFVKVNCAALNENLLVSELFGHEKGAFTGAIQTRKGRIEEAESGTLFLDEIGDFPPSTQIKLLRVLQEREYERVGSNQTRTANVRIICATNRNLEEAIEDGSFRQDLYYRINVFPIFLPPLRDRKDDILLLADFFVEKYAKQFNKPVGRISTPAINMMVQYHWPGNVRELENCIERAVLVSTDGVIHGHHLPPSLQTPEITGTFGTGSLDEKVAIFERDIIVDSLKRTRGNMAASARELGTTPRILRYKVKNLNVDPEKFKK